MQISNNFNNKQPSYKGLWNNKTVLKGLEAISDHGTTFVAATTLAMAVGARPLAIALTPDVKKENKQYAATNSIASGLIKFGMVEAIAIPVENAIKKIDKTPENFLKPETIQNLQGNAKSLAESKSYKFGTQFLKQSTNFITAIPKAMLTVALIPVIMNKFFGKKKVEEKTQKALDTSSFLYNKYNPVFADDFQNINTKSPSFKGVITNQTAKGIGKLINTNTFQNAAKKFCPKDADIARNMSMATDLLLTASFIHRTNKNDKIEKERKNVLIYNNLISTGITFVGGVAIDNFIKKNTESFIKKFSEINKNDPKLNKYIEGINILRPTMIFAVLYYGILPVFSTYISDKIDNIAQKKTEKQ